VTKLRVIYRTSIRKHPIVTSPLQPSRNAHLHDGVVDKVEVHGDVAEELHHRPPQPAGNARRAHPTAEADHQVQLHEGHLAGRQIGGQAYKWSMAGALLLLKFAWS
jgi:hypothetical protein